MEQDGGEQGEENERGREQTGRVQSGPEQGERDKVGGDQIRGQQDIADIEENSSDEWELEYLRKHRTDREYEIENMLRGSKTKNMLEEKDSEEEECSSKAFTLSYKVKERKESNWAEFVNSQTDIELFESGDILNKGVIESQAYKARATTYAENYIETSLVNNTLEEILCAFDTIPEVVKKSPTLKNRLKHLTKKEKK